MPEPKTTAEQSPDVDLSPVPATAHHAIAERDRTLPLAPWRFVVIATVLLLAAPVGIYAAAPVWNGADLAVLILLATLVAALIPGRTRS